MANFLLHERNMKKLAILPAVALTLLFVACTDEKTTTNATVGDTTTVSTTTHTETTTVPTVDTAATAAAAHDVHETATSAAKDVHDTATSAEHKTGTALEKAGKKIQKDAKQH